MPTRVVVIRHGARLDEENRLQWHKIRTEETRHDPPLTQNGWSQARDAGRTLRMTVLRQLEPTKVFVYSSPTARTLSTAAGVAKELGVAEVTPAYALNCCAAAQSHGVVNGFPKRAPTDDTMGEIQLACWPPVGDAQAVNRRLRSGSFVETVKEIASMHNDDELVVLITHREGIWELQNHVHDRLSGAKYCSLTDVSYDSTSKKLSSWTLEPRQKAVSKGRRRSPSQKCVAKEEGSSVVVEKGDQASAGPENSTSISAAGVEEVAETLESALATGSGQVMIHRGGRHGTATLLWCTPGVRGKWVDGGGVPDGEVVKLLSTPQASEGDEGDFVLVRRASGNEGWTKVKNVRLPSTGR
mmetsp:Transcript_118643/g.215769  ORF Transcript_118643/g.215769 Transcript_118643/m.215769 type:complete len:356 (-) Transcript_118643:69-1136(-)